MSEDIPATPQGSSPEVNPNPEHANRFSNLTDAQLDDLVREALADDPIDHEHIDLDAAWAKIQERANQSERPPTPPMSPEPPIGPPAPTA